MRRENLLDQMTRHAAWADAEVWRTVLGAAGSASSALDSRLENWLHHIHLVQHAFLLLWRGRPLEFPEVGDFADPRALALWGRQGHAEIRDFLGAADDAELDRELEIPWTEEVTQRWDGPVRPVRVAQSVAQVAMHSTHHRGQVAARLRETGVEPPLVDYIAWVWFGQPEAEWPVG